MRTRGAFRAPLTSYYHLPILRLATNFRPLAQDDAGWAQTPPSHAASFLLVHVDVLSVDDTFVLLLLLRSALRSRSRSTRSRTSRSRLCLVHGLCQLVRSRRQLLASRI